MQLPVRSTAGAWQWLLRVIVSHDFHGAIQCRMWAVAPGMQELKGTEIGSRMVSSRERTMVTLRLQLLKFQVMEVSGVQVKSFSLGLLIVGSMT